MEEKRIQSRSEETKSRILAAGRRQFGEQGYERTTIRSVAAEANIDPSLVMRYFGSKDGLFSAAIEINLHFPVLRDMPKNEVGRRLVQHFLHIWEDSDATRCLPALLRAGATNKVAAQRLRAILVKQVRPGLQGFVPEKDIDRVLGLFTSQMLGLAYTRYVLRLPAVVALDRDTIVEYLGATVQKYIVG